MQAQLLHYLPVLNMGKGYKGLSLNMLRVFGTGLLVSVLTATSACTTKPFSKQFGALEQQWTFPFYSLLLGPQGSQINLFLVIDDSPSMENDQAALASNFAALSSALTEASDVCYHAYSTSFYSSQSTSDYVRSYCWNRYAPGALTTNEFVARFRQDMLFCDADPNDPNNPLDCQGNRSERVTQSLATGLYKTAGLDLVHNTVLPDSPSFLRPLPFGANIGLFLTDEAFQRPISFDLGGQTFDGATYLDPAPMADFVKRIRTLSNPANSSTDTLIMVRSASQDQPPYSGKFDADTDAIALGYPTMHTAAKAVGIDSHLFDLEDPNFGFSDVVAAVIDGVNSATLFVYFSLPYVIIQGTLQLDVVDQFGNVVTSVPSSAYQVSGKNVALSMTWVHDFLATTSLTTDDLSIRAQGVPETFE